jgi:hypothetical protein
MIGAQRPRDRRAADRARGAATDRDDVADDYRRRAAGACRVMRGLAVAWAAYCGGNLYNLLDARSGKPNRSTESIMMAHGFKVGMLHDLDSRPRKREPCARGAG